jgi:hypothetical protein
MAQRTKWDAVAEIISMIVVLFAIAAFPGLIAMAALAQ